jgi:hypothetical protein
MSRLPPEYQTDGRLRQIRDELRAIRIGVWLLVLIVIITVFLTLLGIPFRLSPRGL